MPERWQILVMSRWCDVVREADAVIGVGEVHVDQALIGTIEGDVPLGHGQHGVEIIHVGRQDHDAGVEQIGPANIGRGREGMREVKELIRSTVCNHICIDVHNFAKLGLSPEVDLGESRVQVRAVHELEVGRLGVADAIHGNDVVVNSLRAAELGLRSLRLEPAPGLGGALGLRRYLPAVAQWLRLRQYRA